MIRQFQRSHIKSADEPFSIDQTQPPVGTTSVAAHPGLAWLVLVGTEDKLLSQTLCSQSTLAPAPRNSWPAPGVLYCAPLPSPTRPRRYKSEDLAYLVDVVALRQAASGLTWEALRPEWERVPMRKQAILAALIRELAVSP